MKKRYKINRWGQLPIFPGPEEGGGSWTVRPVFLTLMTLAMVFVFAYLALRA